MPNAHRSGCLINLSLEVFGNRLSARVARATPRRSQPKRGGDRRTGLSRGSRRRPREQLVESGVGGPALTVGQPRYRPAGGSPALFSGSCRFRGSPFVS